MKKIQNQAAQKIFNSPIRKWRRKYVLIGYNGQIILAHSTLSFLMFIIFFWILKQSLNSSHKRDRDSKIWRHEMLNALLDLTLYCSYLMIFKLFSRLCRVITKYTLIWENNFDNTWSTFNLTLEALSGMLHRLEM